MYFPAVIKLDVDTNKVSLIPRAVELLLPGELLFCTWSGKWQEVTLGLWPEAFCQMDMSQEIQGAYMLEFA